MASPRTITDLHPESICIVRLSAIGDTCHALAVVRTLQDTFPAARITWVIGKTEAALLGDIPGIEFIIFDKSKGLSAYANIRQQVRDRHFDVCLCMHASMRANGIYSMLKSPLKLGFDRRRARDLQWLFTNRRIAAEPRQHVLDGMMEFALALGASRGALRWEIPVSDRDRRFANDVIEDRAPILLISPCSSQRLRNFRNWPAERYIAVARHAVKKHGATIVVTGGPSELERQYGEEIHRELGESSVDLVGRTSLKELLALIARADVVLCPDSGPAHMATAVGTPVIGLYATSNPARTGPYLSQDLVVNAYAQAAMEFCGKTVEELGWGERIRHPEAMLLVKVQEVCDKIDQVLEKAGS